MIQENVYTTIYYNVMTYKWVRDGYTNYNGKFTYNNTFNKPNTLLNFSRNYKDSQYNDSAYHHIRYNYDMTGNLILRLDSSASNINSFPVIQYQTMEYNYRGLMSYYSDQMEYPWVTTQYNYRYSPFGEREYRIAQLHSLIYTHFTIIPVKCLEYYALDLSNRQHAVYQGAGLNNTGSVTEAQACMWPTEYNIFDGSAAGISYKAKYKLVANHDFKFEKYYNLYNSQGSLSCVIASDSTGIDHLSNIYYYDSFGEQKEGVSCDMNSRLGYINKEKDYESGLHDHGVRKYDDLSGRFISVDPLWSKYIGWTPYQYSFNDPIDFKDLDGKDIEWIGDDQEQQYASSKYNEAVIYLQSHGANEAAGKLIELRDNHNFTVKVLVDDTGGGYGDNAYSSESRFLQWNSKLGMETSNAVLTPAEVLAHEGDHAWEDIKHHDEFLKDNATESIKYDNLEEKRAIKNETKTARKLNHIKNLKKMTRKNHQEGKPFIYTPQNFENKLQELKHEQK